MAIKLALTPEIEERLMAQATEQGMTVEAFLKATIENLLNTEPQLYQELP
jgi:predicted DNA-binding protein